MRIRSLGRRWTRCLIRVTRASPQSCCLTRGTSSSSGLGASIATSRVAPRRFSPAGIIEKHAISESWRSMVSWKSTPDKKLEQVLSNLVPKKEWPGKSKKTKANVRRETAPMSEAKQPPAKSIPTKGVAMRKGDGEKVVGARGGGTRGEGSQRTTRSLLRAPRASLPSTSDVAKEDRPIVALEFQDERPKTKRDGQRRREAEEGRLLMEQGSQHRCRGDWKSRREEEEQKLLPEEGSRQHGRRAGARRREADERRSLPEEGSQHSGTVEEVKDFGAFVHLDDFNLERPALLPVSEMKDFFVEDPRMFFQPGWRITVRVERVQAHANGKAKILVSTKPSKIREMLHPDFNPITLVALDLPYDMGERDVKDLFGKYGEVLHVDLLPMESMRFDKDIGEYLPDESSRRLTLVTFAEQEEGRECVRRLHRKEVPLRIGRETYTWRIGVAVAKRQDFKKRAQAQLDREFKERQAWADPEKRRMKLMQRRALADIIPGWKDHWWTSDLSLEPE